MTRTITCLGSGILIYNVNLHWPCSWGEHHKMYVWARLDRVFYTFLPLLRATRQLLDEERGNLLVGSLSIDMNFIWRYLGVYFISIGSIGSAIFPLGRVTFMWVFVFFLRSSETFRSSSFSPKKPQGFSIEAILIYSSNGVVQHHLVMTGFRFMTTCKATELEQFYWCLGWSRWHLPEKRLFTIACGYSYIHALCITYVFICISMYACI